jgi:hypothetical protein
MKTFKQYIKKKERVLIVNTHGSHAQQKNKNPYNETVLEKNSWENYIEQEHNPHLKPSGNEEDIKELNSTHPLNPESHEHIREYTAGSSALARHFIKSHEQNKNPIPEDNSKVHGHDIAALDKSINDHQLKHELTTFTGVGFNPEKLDSNKVITHLSSSLDPDIARDFSKPDTDTIPDKIVYHIIKHNLKTGQPAAVIGRQKHHQDNEYLSRYSSEKEVLLPRTDSTKDKLHLHFNGYTDYPNKYGEIMRVHNAEWKQKQD